MSAIDTSTLRPAAVTRPPEEPVASGKAAGPGPQTGPRIAGLAVSNGEHVLSQDQVLDRLGLRGDEFAEGIFARCGVKRRHLELDDDFLGRDLQGRAAAVETRLLRHSLRAVDALGIDPAKIGTVLSSSLYSLGLPTIAHRLVDHYEMEPTTDKYHITGVACASAVPLMRMAAGTLRAAPRARLPGRGSREHEQHPHASHPRRPARQDGRLRDLRRRLRRGAALRAIPAPTGR